MSDKFIKKASDVTCPPNGWRHYTRDPYITGPIRANRPYLSLDSSLHNWCNPHGAFYISEGPSWFNWCKSNEFRDYIVFHYIRFDPDTRIFVIDNINALDHFSTEYASGFTVDWRRFIKETGVSGIFLSEKMQKFERLSLKYRWKHPWDVGCIVVWDADVVHLASGHVPVRSRLGENYWVQKQIRN